MMKSILPSRKHVEYASVIWRESQAVPGVEFAVRRPSLAQRIDLLERARALALKQEFLNAGDESDQLAASLKDLLVRRLYVEWGLIEVKRLKIDGVRATIPDLIDQGPEELVNEIIEAIKSECGLSEDERKNY
jgi:hypothetical protein